MCWVGTIHINAQLWSGDGKLDGCLSLENKNYKEGRGVSFLVVSLMTRFRLLVVFFVFFSLIKVYSLEMMRSKRWICCKSVSKGHVNHGHDSSAETLAFVSVLGRVLFLDGLMFWFRFLAL